MAKKANEHIDIDYSLEKVPSSARKGFWPMFFIMLGFTFFSASMSVGASLGNGLDLTGFILAILIGGAILGAYMGSLHTSEAPQALLLTCLHSVHSENTAHIFPQLLSALHRSDGSA